MAGLLQDKKIYFPVESLTGIGHFNRTGRIVRSMIAEGADVTVASGTFLDEKRFFNGANTIKMPDYVFYQDEAYAYKLNSDGHEVVMKNFDIDGYKSSRLSAHTNNIKNITPDIVMCEYWPFDRSDLDSEMVSMLEFSKNKTDRLHVLSVRDILNLSNKETITAEQLHKEEQRNIWITETINKLFDLLIIYGDPNFISFDETFPLLDKIKIPVLYSGYVINDLPQKTEEGKYILVSAGSGEGSAPMMHKVIDAWEKLLENKSSVTLNKFHMVCGPRFPMSEFEKIKEKELLIKKKYACDIQVELYRQDFNQLMANASFSISLAGYNTSLEIMALEVPALFIPKYRFYTSTQSIKINPEQLYRLEKLKKLGISSYLLPNKIEDVNIFAKAIESEYLLATSKQRTCPQLNFNGTANTIQAIADRIKAR